MEEFAAVVAEHDERRTRGGRPAWSALRKKSTADDLPGMPVRKAREVDEARGDVRHGRRGDGQLGERPKLSRASSDAPAAPGRISPAIRPIRRRISGSARPASWFAVDLHRHRAGSLGGARPGSWRAGPWQGWTAIPPKRGTARPGVRSQRDSRGRRNGAFKNPELMTQCQTLEGDGHRPESKARERPETEHEEHGPGIRHDGLNRDSTDRRWRRWRDEGSSGSKRMEFLTGTAGCHAWTRVNIKPVLGRFPRFAVPRGGWRTEGSPDPLDLDGARPARSGLGVALFGDGDLSSEHRIVSQLERSSSATFSLCESFELNRRGAPAADQGANQETARALPALEPSSTRPQARS